MKHLLNSVRWNVILTSDLMQVCKHNVYYVFQKLCIGPPISVCLSTTLGGSMEQVCRRIVYTCMAKGLGRAQLVIILTMSAICPSTNGGRVPVTASSNTEQHFAWRWAEIIIICIYVKEAMWCAWGTQMTAELASLAVEVTWVYRCA